MANAGIVGSSKLPYHPHIDGLRALAIIPVVIYHLSHSWCPGGLAGVDIFFVISGFLITRIIVSEMDAGSFSIVSFYTRRIKRIIPAYFVLVLTVLAVLPFVYTVYRYRSVGMTALYSAFFSTNIYFNGVISYIDIDARHNPLLNLWSLSVEEQYYLAIPALIWLLRKAGRGFFLGALVVLFAASFIFSVFCIGHGHTRYAFFMLPGRGWELLAGSILSQVGPLPIVAPAWRPLAAWLGLLFIVVPYSMYNDLVFFPGWAALPCIAGASLLILFGDQERMGALLSCKPAVWVGKVSYSLYLWHWPLFIFLGSNISPGRAPAGIAAALIATMVSYRFVEAPVRRNKAIKAPFAFAMLAAGGLLVAGGGWLLSHGTLPRNGELPLKWRGANTWLHTEQERSAARSSCSYQDLASGDSRVLIKIGKEGVAPDFALWGDSFALALLPGVDAVASENGRAGFFINLKHSLTMNPSIGVYPFKPREDREPVLAWLESRPDIKSVFLANDWFYQLASDADAQEAIRIAGRLHSAGKDVFFFSCPPHSNENALLPLSQGKAVDQSVGAMSVQAYDSLAIRQGPLARDLAKLGFATVVPINEAFLTGTTYQTSSGTQSFYMDINHLNKTGAIKAMEFAAPTLWKGR